MSSQPAGEMAPTAQLVVRRLPAAVKEALRLRAIHNGRSLEAEIRAILIAAAAGAATTGGTAMQMRASGRAEPPDAA